MSQLMETLFELLDSPKSMDAETRAIQVSETIVQAVQRRLTDEEFDRFWDSTMAVGYAGQLDSFTMGFRLGVQLTIEGRRPIV